MSRARVGLLAAFAALATSAAPVAAAPPLAGDRPVTEGVERVYHDYSSEGDASSLELNPALLSSIDGLDLTLLGYRTLSDRARGTGFGGFWAASFRFGLALGLGVQAVRPHLRLADYDRGYDGQEDFTKVSFALSVGDREHASLGVGVHGIRMAGGWLTRPDVDVGAVFRVLNWASFGVNGRFAPASLESAYPAPELGVVGELAVRPLGTHHLELAGGVKARFPQALSYGDAIPLRDPFVGPRGRLAVRYHGFAIKGEIEEVRAIQLSSGVPMPVDDARALRGSIAIEAAWDFVSAQVGFTSGVSGGVDGIGALARFTTSRQGRVYWPRRVAAERIELDDVDDDRDLIRLLERIERAREAGSRTILVVDASDADLGWATAQEIRQALVRVRTAGGRVFAYAEDGTLPGYYVASAAEKIYLHPAGELGIFGLSSTQIYFHEALSRLGVGVEALHVDEYKSAHEPLTRDDPSAADREQREALLDDVYGQIVADIAQARRLDPAALRSLVDQAPHGPHDAVKHRLADVVVYRDQLLEHVSAAVEARVEFSEFPDTRPEHPTWSTEPYVAMVLVDGTIVDGESRTIPFFDISFVGGDTIATTLRELRADPACRGVILRVDSPGGSALASDVIWREVARTHEAHVADPKRSPPVVVSMGDTAGSGGYYVAMGAKKVFAQPATLTGSIGVVSLHFDLSGLLAKLGISTTTFKRGASADVKGPFRPYAADERRRLEASMRRTYDLFAHRVSTARALSTARVHELGRGRIYSGARAEKLGLVDDLGGIHDAMREIRRLARVPASRELAIRVLPRRASLFDLILEAVGNPFDRRGPVARRVANRRANAQSPVPLALDEAFARLPLSLLFVPQGQAQVLMPSSVQLDTGR